MLTTVGLTGRWVLRTAADTDWVEAQAAAVLRQPEVSDELATGLVDEFGAAVDIDALLAESLPPDLDRAEPVLRSAARRHLIDATSSLLSSDRFIAVTTSAVGLAHHDAVLVLTGDPPSTSRVSVAGGEVQVNLVPLVPAVVAAAQEIGLYPGVTVPTLDPAATPAEQIDQVNAALGTRLPPDFAQPVVFRGKAVDQFGTTVNTARSVVLWARRLVWLLLVAGVAFAAAAVWLARARLRALAVTVGAFVVAMLAVRWVVGTISGKIPDVITGPGAAAAVRQVTDNAVSTLTTWYVASAVVVVGGALAAWWLSTRRSAPAPMSAP